MNINPDAKLLDNGRVGTQAKIAIAVITYNRLPSLKICLEEIERYSKSPYDLVVCDDGSSDGTLEWLDSQAIATLGGINKGIAWNKNRGLYALLQYSDADVIVLLEDDCAPSQPDWIEFWASAALRWGHVNLVHPHTSSALSSDRTPEEILEGTGTVSDPYACMRISGLCIASSRSALAEVGYLDSRFKGYGHEHAEWTTRFRNVGHGIRWASKDGNRIKANAMLAYGLRSLDTASVSDKSTTAENKLIYDECRSDPSQYRAPWRSGADRDAFLDEIAHAMKRHGARY